MSWQRSPWPVTLRHSTLALRPLRRRDREAWEEQRAHNREWLTPWDATSPVPVPNCLVEKNGSKILSRMAWGMPAPLSMTSMAT